jgi:hypothetical protein
LIACVDGLTGFPEAIEATFPHADRKQAEGKTRREALRALKRHLVRRVYRLLQPPASDAPGRPPIISPAGTIIACDTPNSTST